jgi:hypothetical protein
MLAKYALPLKAQAAYEQLLDEYAEDADEGDEGDEGETSDFPGYEYMVQGPDYCAKLACYSLVPCAHALFA